MQFIGVLSPPGAFGPDFCVGFAFFYSLALFYRATAGLGIAAMRYVSTKFTSSNTLIM